MEGSSNLTAGNIADLVFTIISPILGAYKREMDVGDLRRRRRIIYVNDEIDGREEYITLDLVTLYDKEHIVIVGGIGSCLEQAMKQCLLTMIDMDCKNRKVFGFVTTGESWRMIEYKTRINRKFGMFKMTNKMGILFNTMVEAKGKAIWLKEYSVLVDCMYAALQY